ncbi:MAG TPA: hypothetical protein VKT52_01985, partial [Ktedonobacterales bacterium]|nr:hypothetical protein [Ktedonobacterales bacterium]
AFPLLLVLGSVFNIFSGAQLDVQTPYDYPVRVVGTLLGDTPGLLFALGGLGYALYDAAQRHAPRWFIALFLWPVIPLLASSLMFAGALSLAPLWFLPLVLLPLAPFLYGLIAASVGTRPAPLAPAPRRYVPFVGILIAVTVALGVFLSVLAPQLVGSGPVSPPVLQVDPMQSNAACAKGIYPQVTLANVGTQTITWTARSQDANVMVTPASGTLAPNSTMLVAVEGATSARQVNIQFTPSIGTGFTAEFTCQ